MSFNISPSNQRTTSLYTDTDFLLLMIFSFEDVIRASNGELQKKTKGEIYPKWDEI